MVRLFGLGIIAVGGLFAWFFIYLPVHDGPTGFVGPVPIKAVVFVPFAFVLGLGLVVGGGPVLVAFQEKRRSRARWTIVWSLLGAAMLLSGITFWLLKTRWQPPPKGPTVIREFPGTPKLPPPRPPIFPSTRGSQ